MMRDLDPGTTPARIIVARAQAGDLASLDHVLGHLQSALHRHILAIVRDPDDTRDALQETLMTIARKLPTLRQVEWLRAWAYRIATRQALRHVRNARRWREALRGTEVLDAMPAADSDTEATALVDDARALLERLSPASEVVLRMHYLDGLTHVEIAEALEIPVGTVKSRLSYGLTAIRKLLASAQHDADATR